MSPGRRVPPPSGRATRPAAADLSRVRRCPRCGDERAEVLFQAVRCPREGCPAYDRRRADEVALERALVERVEIPPVNW